MTKGLPIVIAGFSLPEGSPLDLEDFTSPKIFTGFVTQVIPFGLKDFFGTKDPSLDLDDVSLTTPWVFRFFVAQGFPLQFERDIATQVSSLCFTRFFTQGSSSLWIRRFLSPSVPPWV